MSNYNGVYGKNNGHWKDGHHTHAEVSQRMRDAGFGLSEAEIEEFYARVERARASRIPQRENAIEDMRLQLEKRYGPTR